VDGWMHGMVKGRVFSIRNIKNKPVEEIFFVTFRLFWLDGCGVRKRVYETSFRSWKPKIKQHKTERNHVKGEKKI
jgi:hypothetical protein